MVYANGGKNVLVSYNNSIFYNINVAAVTKVGMAGLDRWKWMYKQLKVNEEVRVVFFFVHLSNIKFFVKWRKDNICCAVCITWIVGTRWRRRRNMLLFFLIFIFLFWPAILIECSYTFLICLQLLCDNCLQLLLCVLGEWPSVWNRRYCSCLRRQYWSLSYAERAWRMEWRHGQGEYLNILNNELLWCKEPLTLLLQITLCMCSIHLCLPVYIPLTTWFVLSEIE